MKLFNSILFLVILCIGSYANAQKAPVKIGNKDGTTFTAIGKLKDNRIKIWESTKLKPYFLDLDKIEYVHFRYGKRKGDKVYRSVLVKGRENPSFLEELVKGEISLFKDFTANMVMGATPMGAGGPMIQSYNIVDYYVKRSNESNAIHLASNELFSKNFKKAASEFFSDCPQLVAKVQNKEFKKKDIKEIVTFYNETCD